MARLAGVDLPSDKRMEIALTYIYGVGRTHSHELLSAPVVCPDLPTASPGAIARAYLSPTRPGRGSRGHRRVTRGSTGLVSPPRSLRRWRPKAPPVRPLSRG